MADAVIEVKTYFRGPVSPNDQNVYHFYLPDVTIPNAETVANEVLTLWDTYLAPHVALEYELWRCTWRQLDALFSYPELDVPMSGPLVGAQAGNQMLPQNVAARIHFASATIKPNRAKKRFGGIHESLNQGGKPTSALLTSLSNMGNALIGNGPLAPTYKYVVVRQNKLPPSVVYNFLTTYTVPTTWGGQDTRKD